MKAILIFVSTLDGKITKWGDPIVRAWSSKSDQDYFDTIWSKSRVIIMGSGTYDPAPVKPTGKHLYIVMTRKPAEYSGKEIRGKLEFSSESPGELVSRFKEKGEKKILIVGGPLIATLFLKDQLIDELWLTLEPKIFGTGGNFVIEDKLDIELRLLSCTRANDKGTLITKYRIIKKKD